MEWNGLLLIFGIIYAVYAGFFVYFLFCYTLCFIFSKFSKNKTKTSLLSPTIHTMVVLSLWYELQVLLFYSTTFMANSGTSYKLCGWMLGVLLLIAVLLYCHNYKIRKLNEIKYKKQRKMIFSIIACIVLACICFIAWSCYRGLIFWIAKEEHLFLIIGQVFFIGLTVLLYRLYKKKFNKDMYKKRIKIILWVAMLIPAFFILGAIFMDDYHKKELSAIITHNLFTLSLLCSFLAYGYIVSYFYTLPQKISAYRDYEYFMQPTMQQITIVTISLLIITGLLLFSMAKAGSFAFFILALATFLFHKYNTKYLRILIILVSFGAIGFLMPLDKFVGSSDWKAFMTFFIAIVTPGVLITFFFLLFGALYSLCFVCLRLPFILSQNKEKLEETTVRYLFSLALKIYVAMIFIYSIIEAVRIGYAMGDYITALILIIAGILLYKLYRIKDLEDLKYHIQGEIIKFAFIVLLLWASFLTFPKFLSAFIY